MREEKLDLLKGTLDLLVLQKRHAFGVTINRARGDILCRTIAQVRTAAVGITTAQRETTIPTPAKMDTQAPINLGGKSWKEKAARGPSHLL